MVEKQRIAMFSKATDADMQQFHRNTYGLTKKAFLTRKQISELRNPDFSIQKFGICSNFSHACQTVSSAVLHKIKSVGARRRNVKQIIMAFHFSNPTSYLGKCVGQSLCKPF